MPKAEFEPAVPASEQAANLTPHGHCGWPELITVKYIHYITHIIFFLVLQPRAGYGLLVSRGFLITHNDAPHSVGLLWASDQCVAETST
jgi:hypothetical protein